MIKLAVITDEFTQDLETAIRFAKLTGLSGLELRTIDSLPMEKLSEERLHEIHSRLEEENLKVCDIAGSFYKCLYQDRGNELEKLKKLIKAAKILGCSYIRCFGFLAENAPSSESIKEAFAEPLKLIKEAGMTLLLEADPSVTTTNHTQLKELIESIGDPSVGAIYDPGNDIYDPLHEVPYPDGWEQVAPYVRHIHIKDAVLLEDGPHCVKVGTGQVDFPGILAALRNANYDGYLSLECHYRKGHELTEEQMKLPGGQTFSSGGEEACYESCLSLKKLLEEADQ